MIITCPHCQTRYQVARDAIGAVGRKVQCAHCQQAWQATATAEAESAPLEAPPVDAVAEKRLDADLEMAAREAAVEADARQDSAPALDPALQRTRQKAFSRRQNSLTRRLPMARMRRGARTLALVALVALAATFYFMRDEIVRQFPDLAGLYAGLGMSVNVVGLDFSDITTLNTLRGGESVLVVSARIHATGGRRTPVPPVIVTLLDSAGQPLYEWSVGVATDYLGAGESIRVETQLTRPPQGAASVKLRFANTRAQARDPVERQ